MNNTRVNAPPNCLVQTSLKWQSNGELSSEDRRVVMELLLQTDGCASAMRDGTG
jgi:hypothetical protein